MQSDDNLDAILNSALEDFENLENTHVPTTTTTNSDTHANNPFDFSRLRETLDRLADTKNETDSSADALLDQMFKEFDSQSGYQGVLQGMMKQLLAKEVLYEPMKEMYNKYPTWLEANKGTLNPTDYQNYVKQFGYIEQILSLYDSRGDGSFDEILRLMREMQYCGQVPADIVKQLAPDVEFGPDGQPKFPGLEGLDNLNTDQCTIL